MTESELLEEKERLIKDDLSSISNRVRHAFNQGYELGRKSIQKTGVWVGVDEEPHEDYECNLCGYMVSTYGVNIEPHTEYKFCPNCGAKMEG